MAIRARCLLVLAFPVLANASNGFLQPLPQEQDTLTPEQHSAVLTAIEQALGTKNRQATELRMRSIEALLEPTLASLPKNEYGKFGHKAARYALHRLFVQRHAWFVKGIGIDVMDGANETPIGMLQGGVPELVQTLFETRFGSHGVDAHEVAVMAATLENLAHMESMERLRKSYSVLSLSPGAANLTKSEVHSLLDVYMASFVTRTNITLAANISDGHAKLLAFAKKKYPGWEAVCTFIREVMDETARDQETFSFVDVSHVITRIGDKYGRWQSYECDDLKRTLFNIEDDGTGRVSLSKFYNAALNHGHWQFTESAEYLRAAGILDESNPANPRVIVANYILSPSNCVAASSYYSVCCLDECEDLLDHLEREIRAPAATAEQIATIVAAMPSSTTPNRTISAPLLARLHKIAAGNGGMVPLHGRLFAQWMHHVYPRECAFPHLSGTAKSMRTKDFEEQTGKKASATKEEMELCVAVSPEGDVGSSDVPWSDEDELFVEFPALQAESSDRFSPWGIFRFAVFFVPAFSMILFLLRVGRVAGICAEEQDLSKGHFV